jgi:uncharacterized protein YndB with AHSA1/START domain
MRHRNLLIIVIGIVGVLFAGGLLLPETKSVERSLFISASPSVLFALAVDLSKHPLWNARKSRDHMMRIEFPGLKTAGKGAVYTWTDGDGDVGRCTILDAVPSTSITLGVSVEGKGEGIARWLFDETRGGTKVTRRFDLSIPLPVLGPWMLRFIDLEGTLGADFAAELRSFSDLATGVVVGE